MNQRLVEMRQQPGGTGAFFSLRPLISNLNGDLRYVFKDESNKNLPFSEIYFSEVKSKSIKAWKLHSLQTQNISVAYGEITIICVKMMQAENIFEVFKINSAKLHGVLNIPIGIHYAMINSSDESTVLMNATDIVHDSAENHSLPLDYPDLEALISEYGMLL